MSSVSSLSSMHSDVEDTPRPTKRRRTQAVDEENAPKATKKTRRKGKVEGPDHKPEDFVVRAYNAWKIGPHVSAAGGVENAIINAASVGANAFAIFLKSQRKWDSNALKDESIARFKERMKAFGYSPSHVLPHGNYLVNLGNPDPDKREKSYECFVDDLKRCEQLGLSLYNFHPGSTVGAGTLGESLSFIAGCINRAHKETSSVIIVLENMAGSGNVIGSRFSELGDIIRQVDDKSRVGVCLDTCHMYAAGYDITTREGWQATMEEFDREIGIGYLRGMHLNDSKAALGSKKDRHENIGLGHLGLRTFVHILADPRTRYIPLILETPAYDVQTGSSAAARQRFATEGMGVWRTEVAVLNGLSGRAKDDGQVDVTEEDLEERRKEIEEAVSKASKLRDGKGKKVVEGGKAKQKSKRKRAVGADDEDIDDDEQEDGGSCCESDH
ncbi:AP endonuclease [Trametes sanguinea]|nr:AP endonuclease [Trametes sanguinea]